jgi:hypothetical protein
MPAECYWHLEWEKSNEVKDYWFTVRNMDRARKSGAVNNCLSYSSNRVNLCPVNHLWNETTNPTGCFSLLDIVYEVHFPNPGGNDSQPAGRVRSGDDFFQRNFEPDDQSKLFEWDGDALKMTMNVIGQIMLRPEGWKPDTGSLRIEKGLDGWFHTDWNVNNNTVFRAIVKSGDRFLTFDPIAGQTRQYQYTGSTNRRETASTVEFSVNGLAEIIGIPHGFTLSVEEVFDVDTVLAKELIKVTYTYDGNAHANSVTITDGHTHRLMITNDYSHGVGYLEVHKVLDGFAKDWGVSDSTVFHVRIYDIDYGNYLLFQSTPGPDGTYRCIGNNVMGLSEGYIGTPIDAIPISVNQYIVQSVDMGKI